MKYCLIATLYFLSLSLPGAENSYHYSINLNTVANRKMLVELIPPKLTDQTITFAFPAMVPGAYTVYDFGRFVDDLRAWDLKGNPVSINHPDQNSWMIDNKAGLSKITYQVSDTYHPKVAGKFVNEPVGSDFETDTCYVLNLHCILGYFRNYTKLPYHLSVAHRRGFYGSTSLSDMDSSGVNDSFFANTYHEAIDNPMMYTRPDTAHIKIGESDVLVSIYTPSKKANAKGIALSLDSMLECQRRYMGGKLPVNKYSFLIYLSDHDGLNSSTGALEHSYSSLYYLDDGSSADVAADVKTVASHEFFHIITPLNIHAQEIENFDFDQPKMSEHLWLYEGSTEYHAYLMQVRYGLMSQKDFFKAIRRKMNSAMFEFNDSLSFTEVSKGCLDTFKAQKRNVYNKGLLINLCLDLKLLHLSQGKYGLMDLIHDLSNTYGKNKSFKDEELIPKIVSLTYPEINTFFNDYVIGNKPLPLEEVLGYAGIEYHRIQTKRQFSIGCENCFWYKTDTGMMQVKGVDKPGDYGRINEFGKVLGFRDNDNLATINGDKITAEIFDTYTKNWMTTVKEGDQLKLEVYRKTPADSAALTVLAAKVFKPEVTLFNVVEVSDNAPADQMTIRNLWLQKRD